MKPRRSYFQENPDAGDRFSAWKTKLSIAVRLPSGSCEEDQKPSCVTPDPTRRSPPGYPRRAFAFGDGGKSGKETYTRAGFTGRIARRNAAHLPGQAPGLMLLLRAFGRKNDQRGFLFPDDFGHHEVCDHLRVFGLPFSRSEQPSI